MQITAFSKILLRELPASSQLPDPPPQRSPNVVHGAEIVDGTTGLEHRTGSILVGAD
jgi:hypothetical protein